MDLTSLSTLGRSGLPVSPLTLGTMTMGNADWGSTDEESRQVFDAYVDAGGNSLDTADVYAGGRSEELVGRFIAERGLRDRVVLATKAGFLSQQGNALAGGASRLHLTTALEGSLRRLATDHVDLYWLHVWDRVTPAEEVLATMVDLIRAGKIRYYGLSDVPAWFAVRVATLAEAHGVPGPIALQLEHSLVERSVEREHLPAGRALGLGLVPWSALAGGFLAGTYERTSAGRSGSGRLSGPNPFGESKFTDANWATLDVVRRVADEQGCSPSQVALAWVRSRPGVSTTLIGVRTPKQLTDNLGSLDVVLSAEQQAALDEVSAIDPGNPYGIYTDEVMRNAVTGVDVRGWSGA